MAAEVIVNGRMSTRNLQGRQGELLPWNEDRKERKKEGPFLEVEVRNRLLGC